MCTYLQARQTEACDSAATGLRWSGLGLEGPIGSRPSSRGKTAPWAILACSSDTSTSLQGS